MAAAPRARTRLAGQRGGKWPWLEGHMAGLFCELSPQSSGWTQLGLNACVAGTVTGEPVCVPSTREQSGACSVTLGFIASQVSTWTTLRKVQPHPSPLLAPHVLGVSHAPGHDRQTDTLPWPYSVSWSSTGCAVGQQPPAGDIEEGHNSVRGTFHPIQTARAGSGTCTTSAEPPQGPGPAGDGQAGGQDTSGQGGVWG